MLANNQCRIHRDYRPSFNGNRLFIPLALSGCGIGCRYCYIPYPQKKVIPLSITTLLADIEKAIEDPRFLSGSNGTVICLGCDTDPFVSEQTTHLTLKTLDVFKSLRNPIQLATKCIIPQDIICFLNIWPKDKPKPILYTSLTTISNVHLLEPNAHTVQDRAKNLTLSNGRWLVGVMIKPVLEATLHDQILFYELLSSHPPDVIVIGVRYLPTTKRGFLPHPFDVRWNGGSFTSSELNFAKSFDSLRIPVFYSSLCATAKMLRSTHALEIYNKHPNLCAKCGLCEILNENGVKS